jgi:hypothetical protein
MLIGKTHRIAEGRERTALWVLLVLWTLGFAVAALHAVLQWRAGSEGDVFSQPELGATAFALLLAA